MNIEAIGQARYAAAIAEHALARAQQAKQRADDDLIAAQRTFDRAMANMHRVQDDPA